MRDAHIFNKTRMLPRMVILRVLLRFSMSSNHETTLELVSTKPLHVVVEEFQAITDG